MKLAVLFVLLLVYFSVQISNGIICWTCNARSERECQKEGRLVDCRAHRDICATIVRRSPRRYQIIKRCKQQRACLTDRLQNWQLDGSHQQCTAEGEISTCRCCCLKDFCGTNETCQPVARARFCQAIQANFAHGRVTCTRRNRVGSVCRFQCTDENYVLNPVQNQQVTCLPNGEWDLPIPCCSEPCPPHIRVDLVSMSHRRTVDTFTNRGVARFLRGLVLGQDYLRFARVHFATSILRPHLFFRNTINMTSEEVIKVLQGNFAYRKNDGDQVNTGAALWQVYHDWVALGSRPNTRKVLVLLTEENSDDDVAAPSKALRDFGVTIFPFFWKRKNDSDITINRQQLYEMAGFDNYRRIRTRGYGLHIAEDFFNRYCPDLCPSRFL